jgi:thymidylate synthase ThyX
MEELSKEYIKSVNESNRLFKDIYAVDPQAAQYVVIFANKHPTLVTINLRELVYLTELRSTPQAHFDLRYISREMVRLARRVNPSLDQVFRFLNTREEELGRLSAELRKEIKLKNG